MIQPDSLKQLTKKFVAIPSLSASKNSRGKWNENIMAAAIQKELQKRHVPSFLLQAPDKRNCVVVYKKGQSKKTLVLLAHHDTVGIDDMQGLPALSIDQMGKIKKDSAYFHGRGAGDMKSGIAVGIGILEEVYTQPLSINILFVSAPDEENDSTGILTFVNYLQKLKQDEHLEYIGAINLDSSLGDVRYPELKEVIAGGTVGKLVPSFLVVGKATHASAPYEGISSTAIASKLVENIDSNETLTEHLTRKQKTPPPTCLKFTDLKSEYNTQLPVKSFVYFNYLTAQKTPKDVLDICQEVAQRTLKDVLDVHVKKARKFFSSSSLRFPWAENGNVYTYEQLLGKAFKHPTFNDEFKSFLSHMTIAEPRERNVHIVDFVASFANVPSPFIVIFFSPPFYPSFQDTSSTFVRLITKEVKLYGKKNNISFMIKPTSEGISDMNYLNISQETFKEMGVYEKNNPYFSVEKDVDLKSISEIAMPVANIGPHAFFPHQRDEKVEIAYTFYQLPLLLLKLISQLNTQSMNNG